MTIEPDVALIIAAFTIAAAIVGVMIQLIRWQTSQTIYSKQHTENIKTMQSLLIVHDRKIAGLETLSHAPKE